ncbi:RNA polymerase sigma factor [Achromobacter deleyi]|uniref:RNA polymerase sigma factor n=1 Tax=Achromobacter deleyi TaxID=1353891 RepID=UPI0014921C4D|nr:sigma-70 family RNA polymerase sigma factor [Achromobacter deleyi]QVQ28572.1 sigma-70 family RNA polymerase sigma factor [Achromobacter deleyi]UIP18684.1 sigma-70 family RNA polymerase sigma factor [Achromobacter deleyi]
MSGKGLPELRQLFVESYDALRNRVARRLGGSSELAGDALHDAYLRLYDKGGLDDVQHPQSYLVNTAMHAAIDGMRRDARLLSTSEIEDFLEVEDPAPGPAQSAEQRQEMDGVLALLESMAPRQRDILIAIRVHGLSRSDMAKRWGISERQVGRDLQAAHDFCAAALQRREAK